MLANEAPDEVTIREARAEDAPVCGQICYNAFNSLSQRHGFPCDLPGPQHATTLLSAMFSHPGFYCLVAETGRRVAGSNCLDERSAIGGVGPITIDPQAQNRGMGRKKLMSLCWIAPESGAPLECGSCRPPFTTALCRSMRVSASILESRSPACKAELWKEAFPDARCALPKRQT